MTPVVAEIEAGYRAYRSLNDYEAAIAAGDREAAGRFLLEFGTALTEAVPLGGRFAKAGRVAPALDKAWARIGEKVADLLGAGTIPGGPQLAMASPMGPSRVPKEPNIFRSDDVRGAPGKPIAKLDGKKKPKARVIEWHPPSHYTNWETADEYAEVVDKSPTGGSKPGDIYERLIAGPDTYHLYKRDPNTGKIITDANGEPELAFNADGLRGATILEAKHIEKPKRSPYIDGSSFPDAVREQVHTKLDDQFDRIRKFIEDPDNPLSDLEVVTNNGEAAEFFRRKLEEHGLLEVEKW